MLRLILKILATVVLTWIATKLSDHFNIQSDILIGLVLLGSITFFFGEYLAMRDSILQGDNPDGKIPGIAWKVLGVILWLGSAGLIIYKALTS